MAPQSPATSQARERDDSRFPPKSASTDRPKRFIPSARLGVDASVAVPLLIVHCLGCGLAPFTCSWAGLGSCALLYVFTGLGITAGAHRLFTHRSYVPHPVVREVLAFAFLLAAQGSVRRWVRDHAIHHQFSDGQGDPHSPLRDGFRSAHLGWLWKRPPSREEERALYVRYTRGVDSGVVGRTFRTAFRLAVLHVCVLLGLYALGALYEAGPCWGLLHKGWRTGLSCVVWGGLLRIVLVMHSTFLVNSATHLWGYRRYPTPDGSRNLGWVAFLSLGEGWHNNHHAHPAAANHGFHSRFEFDLTFAFLVLLGKLGWVRDVCVWRATPGRTERWFSKRLP